MKLANDALLCVIEAMRKGLVEGVDISDLLKEIDLVPDDEGKLKLSVHVKDVWTVSTDK